MPATVYVVARFLAKEGKEQTVSAALGALIAPTRRELGCYQYDLLVNPADSRDFCFVERWDGDRSLDQHLESAHVRGMREKVEGLLDEPPAILRYRLA